MRLDKSIQEKVVSAAISESESGCCVRNDNSGCVQSLESECSSLLSTWHKWTNNSKGPDGRVSGPVCGQDPQYCTSPKSSYQYTWLDDITTWPVCHVSSLPRPGSYFGLTHLSAEAISAPRHMTCEIIARPCCIGIHGRCEIRTKEFCDFVNGHFHSDATLCSQVRVMNGFFRCVLDWLVANYTGTGSSIKHPTHNSKAIPGVVNSGVVYPKNSYKIILSL